MHGAGTPLLSMALLLLLVVDAVAQTGTSSPWSFRNAVLPNVIVLNASTPMTLDIVNCSVVPQATSVTIQINVADPSIRFNVSVVSTNFSLARLMITGVTTQQQVEEVVVTDVVCSELDVMSLNVSRNVIITNVTMDRLALQQLTVGTGASLVVSNSTLTTTQLLRAQRVGITNIQLLPYAAFLFENNTITAPWSSCLYQHFGSACQRFGCVGFNAITVGGVTSVAALVSISRNAIVPIVGPVDTSGGRCYPNEGYVPIGLGVGLFLGASNNFGTGSVVTIADNDIVMGPVATNAIEIVSAFSGAVLTFKLGRLERSLALVLTPLPGSAFQSLALGAWPLAGGLQFGPLPPATPMVLLDPSANTFGVVNGSLRLELGLSWKGSIRIRGFNALVAVKNSYVDSINFTSASTFTTVTVTGCNIANMVVEEGAFINDVTTIASSNLTTFDMSSATARTITLSSSTLLAGGAFKISSSLLDALSLQTVTLLTGSVIAIAGNTFGVTQQFQDHRVNFDSVTTAPTGVSIAVSNNVITAPWSSATLSKFGTSCMSSNLLSLVGIRFNGVVFRNTSVCLINNTMGPIAGPIDMTGGQCAGTNASQLGVGILATSTTVFNATNVTVLSNRIFMGLVGLTSVSLQAAFVGNSSLTFAMAPSEAALGVVVTPAAQSQFRLVTLGRWLPCSSLTLGPLPTGTRLRLPDGPQFNVYSPNAAPFALNWGLTVGDQYSSVQLGGTFTTVSMIAPAVTLSNVTVSSSSFITSLSLQLNAVSRLVVAPLATVDTVVVLQTQIATTAAFVNATLNNIQLNSVAFTSGSSFYIAGCGLNSLTAVNVTWRASSIQLQDNQFTRTAQFRSDRISFAHCALVGGSSMRLRNNTIMAPWSSGYYSRFGATCSETIGAFDAIAFDTTSIAEASSLCIASNSIVPMTGPTDTTLADRCTTSAGFNASRNTTGVTLTSSVVVSGASRVVIVGNIINMGLVGWLSYNIGTRSVDADSVVTVAPSGVDDPSLSTNFAPNVTSASPGSASSSCPAASVEAFSVVVFQVPSMTTAVQGDCRASVRSRRQSLTIPLPRLPRTTTRLAPLTTRAPTPGGPTSVAPRTTLQFSPGPVSSAAVTWAPSQPHVGTSRTLRHRPQHRSGTFSQHYTLSNPVRAPGDSTASWRRRASSQEDALLAKTTGLSRVATAIVAAGFGSAVVASAVSPTVGSQPSVLSRLLITSECPVLDGSDPSAFPAPSPWSLMPPFWVTTTDEAWTLGAAVSTLSVSIVAVCLNVVL